MRKLLLVIVALAFASSTVMAQTGVRETTTRATTQPIPSADTGGGGGTNSAAKLGQATQIIGMGMNLAMGYQYLGQCKSTNKMACVLATLSFATAGVMAASAAQSGRVANASSPGGWSAPDMPVVINDPDTWGNRDTPVPGGDVGPETNAGFKKLEDHGYKILPDGSIKTPDGKHLSAKDFKSEESLTAAGISSGDAASIMDSLNQSGKDGEALAKKLIEDAANVVSMGIDGGGGGGGSREPASFDDGDSNFDDYLKRLRNPFGISKDQKAQMVAGKTLSHGDDQIGVKVDDIFKMVHRRYQEKRATDEFIEAPAASPAGANPAAGRTIKTPLKSR